MLFHEILVAALFENEDVVLVREKCKQVEVRFLSFIMPKLKLLAQRAVDARCRAPTQERVTMSLSHLVFNRTRPKGERASWLIGNNAH